MFQIMVFTFPENALNLYIFTHAPVRHLVYNFWKIIFPQDKIDGGNCDVLYQNSIKKYEDDLEH